MVTEISAFEAMDGSIHSTRLAAVEADAMHKLKQLNVFNVGTASAICQHAEEIATVLQPLAEELAKAQREKLAAQERTTDAQHA